jgi:hypothetical protein
MMKGVESEQGKGTVFRERITGQADRTERHLDALLDQQKEKRTIQVHCGRLRIVLRPTEQWSCFEDGYSHQQVGRARVPV